MDGFIRIDSFFTIREVDPWVIKHSGLTEKDMLNQNLMSVFPYLEINGIADRLREIMYTGSPVVLSSKFHRYFFKAKPDFESEYYTEMQQKVSIAPVIQMDVVDGVIITFEDVTQSLEDERNYLKRNNRSVDNDEISNGIFNGGLDSNDWKERLETQRQARKSNNLRMILSLVRGLVTQYHDPGVVNSTIQILAGTELHITEVLEELLNNPNEHVVIFALQTLGDRKDRICIPQIIKLLDNPDQNIQYHAIEALGKLKAYEAIDLLTKIATSGNFFLAFPALETLKIINSPLNLSQIYHLLEEDILFSAVADLIGEIGDLDVIPVLMKYFVAGNETNFDTIAKSILRVYKRFEQYYNEGDMVIAAFRKVYDKDVLKLFEQTLKTCDKSSKSNLFALLGWIPETDAIRILIENIEDEDLVDPAFEAIQFQRNLAGPFLIDLLENPNVLIRDKAIRLIGVFGTKEAVPYLIKLLNKERDVVLLSLVALAQIGDNSAYKDVFKLLNVDDLAIRRAAINTLHSLGHPEMEKDVLEILTKPHHPSILSAISIAGYFGWNDSLVHLKELINNGSDSIRVNCLEALTNFEDDESSDILKYYVVKGNRDERIAAVKSLGGSWCRTIFDVIDVSLNDPEPWVRYYAVQVINKRKMVGFIDKLAQMSLTETVVFVKLMIIQAFGTFGGMRTVSYLVSFLQDSENEVRRNAIQALAANQHPFALDPILDSLRIPDRSLRIEAIIALGNKNSLNAVSALQYLLITDTDEDIINASISSLAAHNSPESVMALMSATIYPDKRQKIITSLSKSWDGKLSFIENSFRTGLIMVKTAAIEILARIKRPEATRIIEEALKHTEKEVRIAALLAINRIYGHIPASIAYLCQHDKDESVQKILNNLIQNKKNNDESV